MKKVLISILGKSNYQLTKYKIFEKHTKLVGDVLKDYIHPDEIYVVGTQESSWSIADEYIKSYEKIIIPYGTSMEEFWEIFRVFASLDIDKSKVYFDMIHGFRSIPFFVSTILNFFNIQKNVKIKGVYYGVFEAQRDGVTPVINMLSFIELNEWIQAANIFIKYSDARDIKGLIDVKYKEFAKNIDDKSKLVNYKEIKNISNELEVYTQSVGFAAVENYLTSLEKIAIKIENIKEYPNGFGAFEFIVNFLDREYRYFEGLDKKWKKFLKKSEIFFYKNRYAQSLTILRETMHYYIYEILDIDMGIKKFDEIVSEIIKNDINNYEFFTKEFLDNVDRIKKLRNMTNHAFLGENISSKKLKNIVNELNILIKTSKEILSNEKNVFNNKEKLQEMIIKD